MIFSPQLFALDREHANAIPHVNQRGRDGFVEYLYAERYKAFAIAPGGAWAWVAQEANEADARRIALEQCQSNSAMPCVLYAVNDTLVFDKQAWPTLWRLNKTNPPAKPSTGTYRGAHFPNLAFKDQAGKARAIADFKGKVTLVHFWGSWCPPCMREMPVLLRLQQALKQRLGGKVALVLLQVREPFSQSMAWAKRNEFAELPLYDSGVASDTDAVFHSREGESLPDRTLALAFPTSYVLDTKGRVVFGHTGPIADWLDYLPFFEDLANSGK